MLLKAWLHFDDPLSQYLGNVGCCCVNPRTFFESLEPSSPLRDSRVCEGGKSCGVKLLRREN